MQMTDVAVLIDFSCFFSNRATFMNRKLDNVVDHVKKQAVFWRFQATIQLLLL